ncbi:MAG TPA: Ig-like domain-containing protein, partial [Anaerolineae bacterium]|nr:Ig-like domain-containing protein [Anaerolineae bacterium]
HIQIKTDNDINCHLPYELQLQLAPTTTDTTTFLPPPTLASVEIIAPSSQTALTTSTPVSITVGASMNNNVQDLFLYANGNLIASQNYPNTDSNINWTTSWTPPTIGIYTLTATGTDYNSTSISNTTPIQIIYDPTPPTLNLTSPTILTTTHIISDQIQLTLTAADNLAVATVQIKFNNNWQNADLVGVNNWLYSIHTREIEDGTYAIPMRVIDLAGHITTITPTIRFDLGAPAANQNGLYLTNPTTTPLTAGALITTPNPTIALSATIPANAVASYAGFTTNPTPNPNDLTYYPGANQTINATTTPAEAQKLYAHIITIDDVGNKTPLTLGPIFADTPQTPDIIAINENQWRHTGGSLVAVDHAITHATAVNRPPQTLHTSWSTDTLRLTWTGADWDSDGQLYIFIDNGSPGTTIYHPNPSDRPIIFPDGMSATHHIRVTNRSSGLFQEWYDGDNIWSLPIPLGPYYQFDNQQPSPTTELLIPFSLLGLNNTSSLKIVAFATDDNTFNLWATAPSQNPLNHPWLIHPSATSLTFDTIPFTHALTWPNLNLGTIPNNNLPAGSDLQLQLTATPNGVTTGYLNHSWWDIISPTTRFDTDLDGLIDFPIPLDSPPKLVGVGDTITYTITYTNTGFASVPNARIDLTNYGATTLANTTYNLGHIPPKTGGTIILTTTVTANAANGLELIAAISDDRLGTYDWWWAHHGLDKTAPLPPVITTPDVVRSEAGFSVQGIVTDTSAVPTTTLVIIPRPSGTTTFISCPQTDPNSGQWACWWPVPTTTNVTHFDLRAFATDEHSNISSLGPIHTVSLDNTPPSNIFLDSATTTALADNTLTPAESQLRGIASDNFALDVIEACWRPRGPALVCQNVPAADGSWTWALNTDFDNVPQTIRLTPIDLAGNRGPSYTINPFIDGQGPTITTTYIDSHIPTNFTNTPIMSGTVTDGRTVTQMLARLVDLSTNSILTEPVTLDGNNWYYIPQSSSVNTHQVIIEALDDVNNIGVDGPYTLENLLVAPLPGRGPGGVGQTNGNDALVLWLKDSQDAITGSNFIWPDQSGYNQFATQPLNTNQPTIIPNAINGQSVIRFDGTDDFLEIADTDLLDFGVGDDFIIFAVIQTTDTNRGAIIAKDVGPQLPSWWTRVTDTGLGRFLIAANGEIGSNIYTIETINDGQPHIFSAYRHATADQLEAAVDGNTPNTTTDIIIGGQENDNPVRIGRFNSGSWPLDGDIAEIIIYQANMKDAQLTIINNYLMAKYNITLPPANNFYAGATPALGDYDFDLIGLGQENNDAHTGGTAAGLTLTADKASLDDGEYLLAAHQLPTTNSWITTNLTTTINSRWQRSWYLDKTGSLTATISFDLSAGGTAGTFTQRPVLLYRATLTDTFTELSLLGTISGDQVHFTLPDNLLTAGYYTLGLAPIPPITLTSSLTTLSWNDNGLGCSWLIHRSPTPYFTP